MGIVSPRNADRSTPSSQGTCPQFLSSQGRKLPSGPHACGWPGSLAGGCQGSPSPSGPAGTYRLPQQGSHGHTQRAASSRAGSPAVNTLEASSSELPPPAPGIKAPARLLPSINVLFRRVLRVGHTFCISLIPRCRDGGGGSFPRGAQAQGCRSLQQ